MADRKPGALRPYTRQKGKNTFETNPKKYDVQGNRRAYVEDQANKNEDRPTQSDIERMENFMKNKDKIKFPSKKIKKPEYLGDTGIPMPREGSPIVTDMETGEVTYGRPKDFNKGGMMECRGGGIAISGKKFQGVF